MKRQLTVLVVCLAIMLTACSTKQPPSETKPSTPTAPPSVTPTASPVTTPAVPSESLPPSQEPTVAVPIWTDRKTSTHIMTEEDGELLNYEISIPWIENDQGISAYEAINSFYDQQRMDLKADAEEQQDWAQDDYRASEASGFPFSPYVMEYTYLITHQTGRYVSISRELYTNTGGAYPTVYRFAEQFDLETGRQLALADFFTDPDAALAVIQKEIAAQNAKEQDLGVKDAALTAAFGPERFYLKDAGFVFYYQGDELGPFHNPVEYTIPFEALEGLTVSWIAD